VVGEDRDLAAAVKLLCMHMPTNVTYWKEHAWI
jgi:hypothetical protein